MNMNDSKKKVDNNTLNKGKDIYPVQQVAGNNERTVSAEEVKNAVEEINPDDQTLERG